MAIENSTTSDGAQIQALIEERVRAIHNKDIDSLMSHHAPDVLSFDVLDPLQCSGSSMVRQRAEKWFSAYPGTIGYEIRDLSITAGDDIAFCHYLYRVSGTMQDGGKVDMWVRATICLSKMRSKWMIVHEHDSVPFNGETGKASLDLKP
jgi:ketosteroid isomerase-like protein